MTWGLVAPPNPATSLKLDLSRFAPFAGLPFFQGARGAVTGAAARSFCILSSNVGM